MPASDAVPSAAAALTLSSGSWMRVTHMLAEKFILALETLIRSRTYPDGSPRVASTSPHVPVKFRSGCRIEPAFRAPSGLQPIAQ